MQLHYSDRNATPTISALKKKFQQKSAQQQLGKLAKYFVISNTVDDEEPWEEEFHPDGKYIPRILFTSEKGT